MYLINTSNPKKFAKDIPAVVSEYISRRSSIEQIGFQSKCTKDFDRQYFASMIKEELQAGYRELLNKKLTLEEQIRNGYADENITQELQIIEGSNGTRLLAVCTTLWLCKRGKERTLYR